MKSAAKALLAIVLSFPLLPAAGRAHGGGLNAEGCHTNRKTGGYHCHRPRAPRSPDPGRWQCGAKVYCTQMLTCAEAQFFFTECGLARLDGDRDGVPCEDLCR